MRSRIEGTARIVQPAEAHLGAGDWESAREAAERGLEGARRCYRMQIEICALRVLALAHAHQGESDGDSLLDEADAVIETSGARLMVPWIAEGRGRIAGLRGDAVERERHLRDAHRLYTEMGATGQAERLARELES